MTIASEITRINNNIASAYTACNSKGATMPATQNSANLATCISSITTSGGTGVPREVVNGVYKAPTTFFTWSLPNTATSIGSHTLAYAFYNCTGLTSVDLSSLTTVSGDSSLYYAFYNCTGLTGKLDLSSLTTVSGSGALYYAFYKCTGLTGKLDLSSLTTVSGSSALYYAFSYCTGLTSVDLSSLTTVGSSNALASAFYNCTGLTSILFTNLQTIGVNTSSSDNSHFTQCFNSCTNLTSITFPKLEKIYCTGGTTKSFGTFANNNKVQKMYFPKLNAITYGSGASTTNQNACKNVFYGCSALTELHFGAANQTAIEASPGYSTAWGRGAGNVTIYFDL